MNLTRRSSSAIRATDPEILSDWFMDWSLDNIFFIGLIFLVNLLRWLYIGLKIDLASTFKSVKNEIPKIYFLFEECYIFITIYNNGNRIS